MCRVDQEDVDQEHAASRSTTRAPYQHIADVLRQEIHDGVFPVGGRLPAQADLETRFGVSRPTVQRALTELRRDGYLDNQRGRASQVLDWRRGGHPSHPSRPSRLAGDEPEPAFAALETHIAEAFEAPHVTLDSYSLTTETLNTVLAAPVNRIMRGELAPASIRVRVLVPAPHATLAIPRLVADPRDDWPLERLRELVRGHVVALGSTFTALRDFRPDVEQSVEFRCVPLTPVHKLYVLNGATALFGHYRVVERPVEHRDGRRGDVYDVLGVGATLFPYRAGQDGAGGGTGGHGERFVSEARAWFDSLWTTIAEPLSLD